MEEKPRKPVMGEINFEALHGASRRRKFKARLRDEMAPVQPSPFNVVHVFAKDDPIPEWMLCQEPHGGGLSRAAVLTFAQDSCVLETPTALYVIGDNPDKVTANMQPGLNVTLFASDKMVTFVQSTLNVTRKGWKPPGP